MSPLREQYIRLLTLRGYAQRTHESYIAAVAALAGHYKRTPASLSDEEIRSYLTGLHHRGLSFSTINVAVSALRLFYGQVLKRPMDELKEMLPRSRRVTRRAGVYAREELRRLFADGCRGVAPRTFLMTVYGAGLRLNEACRLKVRHIESGRMMLRVEQGKGRKDRYTILSPWLLEELRGYYRRQRPGVCPTSTSSSRCRTRSTDSSRKTPVPCTACSSRQPARRSWRTRPSRNQRRPPPHARHVRTAVRCACCCSSSSSLRDSAPVATPHEDNPATHRAFASRPSDPIGSPRCCVPAKKAPRARAIKKPPKTARQHRPARGCALAKAPRPAARCAMPTDLQQEGLQAKILSPISRSHADSGGSVQQECIRRAGGTTPPPQTTPHPRRHGGYTP